MKILIGDNSTFMRTMLASTLETLGFEVVAIARDAQEVLDKNVETKPHMTLIDLALEGMDCEALTRAITRVNPSAVVMLMVPQDLDEPDVIADAVRAGVKGYIRKPISAEKLRALITGVESTVKVTPCPRES